MIRPFHFSNNTLTYMCQLSLPLFKYDLKMFDVIDGPELSNYCELNKCLVTMQSVIEIIFSSLWVQSKAMSWCFFLYINMSVRRWMMTPQKKNDSTSSFSFFSLFLIRCPHSQWYKFQSSYFERNSVPWYNHFHISLVKYTLESSFFLDRWNNLLRMDHPTFFCFVKLFVISNEMR